jgi:hypothetical protein
MKSRRTSHTRTQGKVPRAKEEKTEMTNKEKYDIIKETSRLTAEFSHQKSEFQPKAKDGIRVDKIVGTL